MKIKQEREQRLQRELERVRREEQQKLQQERNRFQRQLEDAQRNQKLLTTAQQERDQARGQLREAQQDLEQVLGQLTDAQQERDQAQQELRQMRTQEEQRKQTWDRLYEILMNASGQPDLQGQSSRGDLRANDALPTTLEGMWEQLEREQGIQQESRERERQIREHTRKSLRERGEDLPINEQLSELLRHKIGNIISDYCLEVELFSHQQERKPLRERLKDLYRQTEREFTSRLQPHEIAGEFGYQLQEQMRAHNREDWETTAVLEDIGELLNGGVPNLNRRTPR